MDPSRVSATLYRTMAKYGWSDIHYSNPFLPGEIPHHDELNRWTVGVRTGPKMDTICIKYCSTAEDAIRYMSPRGSTINEAVFKAVRLYDTTILGRYYSSCKGRSINHVSPVTTGDVSLALPALRVSNQI